MLTCAMNVSEGRDPGVLAELVAAAGAAGLDVHVDPHHHRAVITVAGEAAPRAVAEAAVARLDLGAHAGVHPRLGVVDVVPFTPVDGSALGEAVAARDGFGAWLAAELGVPGFAYGPERTLPDVRRHAFAELAPTWGPPSPHATAGACCVGARPPLVAYNVWLADPDLEAARRVAAAVRGPHVRALGLAVGAGVQVSMNLVAPEVVGPAAAYDLVAAHVRVGRAELVGLMPAAVLAAVAPARWAELDLAPDRTVEGRLAAAGLA